jgi:hypothetical protein
MCTVHYLDGYYLRGRHKNTHSHAEQHPSPDINVQSLFVMLAATLSS